MELAGRAEVKDGPDGGISVALFVDGEVPQGQGRRSNFVDAIQFLANKIVNRPGTSKRWISIGLGAHPEPRPPREARPERPPPPPAQGAPAQHAPAAPAPQAQQAGGPQAQPQRPPRHQQQQPPNGRPQGQGARASGPKPAQHGHGHGPAAGGGGGGAPVEREPPEATMEVAEDPSMSALAKSLATRSAELGRFYAISPIKPEDRARLLRGAQGVAGVKVKMEGDGRSRRVVFTPDKPTPMPKRALPVHDDEA